MLTYSMSVSVDGFIYDRDGSFDWGMPSDELIAFQHEHVSSLGAYLLGRRLYETMLVWETDDELRKTESNAAFADFWTALPKIVFSRTRDRLQGNARFAQGSVAEEIAVATASTAKDISIGGADLAAQAIELDLVDEFRILRNPILVGGGQPYFPPLPRGTALNLVETRVFDNAVIFERYRR